ncbi:MAG: tRNA uridine-5-carboxymethylaminomethyl(34) synthesis GTPase MnmE [Bacteroidales bacterium]|jgi:tRNA modification GTPase|nr:tRNA uridine-5-carboxymethylaminomethyl(34) synthesis GTPase MnmE [Bacteroidales bacterium]
MRVNKKSIKPINANNEKAIGYTDNICAPATASGRGAIGIIRMSGPDVIKIADSIFTPTTDPKRKPLSLLRSESYVMRYGVIYESAKLNKKEYTSPLKNKSSQQKVKQVLDEVLVTVFRAPHSYTGENSVEFYCHASPYIMNKIIMMLIAAGARMAEPGEFTKRAFLNGKMDLAQSEAVADLIASETEAAHNIAMQQMRGGYSKELKQMRESLLNLTSLMELELDFGEEDVEFANRKHFAQLLKDTTVKVSSLIDSFSLGNVIKNGIPVAIVGAVNTGKSTLLNALVGEERAIVSEIQGTTRDTIEDTVNINGTVFRFIDTAGIRNTQETIEIMGIERTWQKIKEASVVILMLDCGRENDFKQSIHSIAGRIDTKRQKLVIVVNKCDLIKSESTIVKEVTSICKSEKVKAKVLCTILRPQQSEHQINTAIQGLAELKKNLSGIGNKISQNTGTQTLVTNARHYQALLAAKESLNKAAAALKDKISTELIAQEVREAVYHLGSIVGEVSSQDVLNNIFKNFCIGK